MTHNRYDLIALVEHLKSILAPCAARLEIAGSFRRGNANIKDLEVVVLPTSLQDFKQVTDKLVYTGQAGKALYGDKHRWGDKYRGLRFETPNGLPITVEVFTADDDNWGYIYWLRSGPGDANRFVMSWCDHVDYPARADKGYWWVDGMKLHIPDEETLFAVWGMPYIRPDIRSVRTYQRYLNKHHTEPDAFSQWMVEELRQEALF